jgi:hypothetical protein
VEGGGGREGPEEKRENQSKNLNASEIKPMKKYVVDRGRSNEDETVSP